MALFKINTYRMAGLFLLLVLSSGAAFAASRLSAARVAVAPDHTRIVLESNTMIRFSLLSLGNQRRVVLDLEGVKINAVLTALADKVGSDHPYIKQIRVGRSGTDGARLALDLNTDVEPRVSTLSPDGRHGYRLVLDLYPLQANGSVLKLTPAAAAEIKPEPLPAAAVPTSKPEKPPSPAMVQPVNVQPSPADTVPSRHDDGTNLLLLEVHLDKYVLSEAITAYQYGRNTFLPLGELARLLTLAIQTHPEQGNASGFVLSEDRLFSLNLAQSTVTLTVKTEAVDPALIKVQADDIYVASQLIARWLPLDLNVDLSSLTLRVRSRELLPLQARLEREQRSAQAGSATPAADPGYQHRDSPYRLLDVPFIDQTLGVDLRGGKGVAPVDARYTAYLTADLLGMESALYVSSNKQQPSPDMRYTLGRHDPDAGLLGPLHARSFEFGSVSVPGVANIASTSPTGNGVTLSNRPLTQPTSFDQHSLQGDLPPGWDVELYFNDALVGFQQSRADGKYNFDDQPLLFGQNEFRLVFHGPLGQLRVEKQSFLLDQSITKPGEFYYSLTEHRDAVGLARSVGQFELGLSQNLAATGGLVRLPVAGVEQLYSNLGLHTSWQSMLFSSNFASAQNGGSMNELGLKTRVGGVALNLSRAQINNFTSDLFLLSADPVRTREKIRIDAAIPSGFSSHLPVTLEAARDHLQSGANNMIVTGRISAYLAGTAVSNQLRWQSTGGATSVDGTFQLGRRVSDIGLSGQLGYTINPQSTMNTVVLSANKSLAAGYLLNLGLIRTLATGVTQYTAGLNKSQGSYGLGISARYSSSGEIFVGAQLFMAMGREPRSSEWSFDAQPKADAGAASVRVFSDNNGNGIMDAGEEPIENVGVTVNGSRHTARTNAAGIAYVDRLPVKQYADIAVDMLTLEDPQWSPQPKGMRLLPRPGNVVLLDFPVVMTSEIDGMVYLVEKSVKRGIGGGLLELVNSEGKVVATTTSSQDGYYIVPAVIPGSYVLRISPEQLRRLQLTDTAMHPITVSSDGNFINGVDFILKKDQVKNVSDLSPEGNHEK